MALVSLANDMTDYEQNYVHSLNAKSFELMLLAFRPTSRSCGSIIGARGKMHLVQQLGNLAVGGVQ